MNTQQTHEQDGGNVTTCMWGFRLQAWQCGASCLTRDSSACNICLFTVEYAWHVMSTHKTINYASNVETQQSSQQITTGENIHYNIQYAYTDCSEAFVFDNRALKKLQ